MLADECVEFYGARVFRINVVNDLFLFIMVMEIWNDYLEKLASGGCYVHVATWT